MTQNDWSNCNIVQINPKPYGVPTVRVNRVPADTVVESHDLGMDDEIASQHNLPIEDVRAILSYAPVFRRQLNHARVFRPGCGAQSTALSEAA